MDVSQHMSLAKRLAHPSDKDIRDAAFATVSAWLEGHKTAGSEDYLKLWKALFYCLWYSDKVPVQQELVFKIARLTRLLHGDLKLAVLFLRTFFQTMYREWMGLDHLRLDKYMSLIRHMIHEALVLLPTADWSDEAVEAVAGLLRDPVLSSHPNGIRYHVIDVLLDEVETAVPDASSPQLRRLLVPVFAHCIATDDKLLFDRLHKEVLTGLLDRTVDAQADEDDDEEEGEEGEDGKRAEGGAASTAAGGDGSASVKLTPLLFDHKERTEAQARAWKNVNLATLATDVFALAALPQTRAGHRDRLYALHKDMTKAALALGHAEAEKACYPSPVTKPTDAVAAALAMVPKDLLPKVRPAEAAAKAWETASKGSPAATGGAGTAAKKAKKAATGSKASAGGKAATIADGGDDSDADHDADMAAVAAPKGKPQAKAAAAKGKVVAGSTAVSGSKRPRPAAAAPAAAADDDAHGDDAAEAAAVAAPAGKKAAAAAAAVAPPAKRAKTAAGGRGAEAAGASAAALLAAIPTVGDMKAASAAASAAAAAAPTAAEGGKKGGKKAAAAEKAAAEAPAPAAAAAAKPASKKAAAPPRPHPLASRR